ncbi:hypothetical protein GALMADRAFT_145813 [Galerina marginata CBS 339.88]|uniref:Uncharacterized protein n=1 Tax=Galerina marginata (strain CBS 339.88) TaxID=685588 RepID=A0A067SN23_GALM3|nr:hypothetical protein GALMADRAFT_145813 [Galerina marginata CBS 339.88]
MAGNPTNCLPSPLQQIPIIYEESTTWVWKALQPLESPHIDAKAHRVGVPAIASPRHYGRHSHPATASTVPPHQYEIYCIDVGGHYDPTTSLRWLAPPRNVACSTVHRRGTYRIGAGAIATCADLAAMANTTSATSPWPVISSILEHPCGGSSIVSVRGSKANLTSFGMRRTFSWTFLAPGS